MSKRPYFKVKIEYYDVESDKYSGETTYEQKVQNLDVQAVIQATNKLFDVVVNTEAPDSPPSGQVPSEHKVVAGASPIKHIPDFNTEVLEHHRSMGGKLPKGYNPSGVL